MKITDLYCIHLLHTSPKHPEQHRWCHGKKQCALSAIHTVCVGAKKQTVHSETLCGINILENKY